MSASPSSASRLGTKLEIHHGVATFQSNNFGTPPATGNFIGTGREVPESTNVTVTLTSPVSYVGFAWGTPDLFNELDIYDGSTLLGSFIGKSDVGPNRGGRGPKINGDRDGICRTHGQHTPCGGKRHAQLRLHRQTPLDEPPQPPLGWLLQNRGVNQVPGRFFGQMT
jgi:hypothetical protein